MLGLCLNCHCCHIFILTLLHLCSSWATWGSAQRLSGKGDGSLFKLITFFTPDYTCTATHASAVRHINTHMTQPYTHIQWISAMSRFTLYSVDAELLLHCWPLLLLLSNTSEQNSPYLRSGSGQSQEHLRWRSKFQCVVDNFDPHLQYSPSPPHSQ